ncbi:uncharacterized protein LOC126845995 [Adelges cooleyi]|uniref:uncharacterized protein LOC126845995 n=1 Tax=Adelges cooleyi TaxID=133065 RepID=UPI0021804699|nr:uncharacterized protein LOC126845995 [Adelges cooleyi]
MIGNICALLLCCFAITSSIKEIESAGNSKINPTRFIIQSTHKNYLRAVNNLKTFNKRPKIVITPTDEKKLSTTDCDSINEYRLKLKSRDKLEKKGRDVMCSFCVIVQSNIMCLKNIVEELISGETFISNESVKIKHFKQEAELIVALYPVENLQTGKWLWSYFLKLIAIRQYDDNKHYIHENPFEDDQLQAGVSDFIGNCVQEKYLPPAAVEPDFVTKNTSISDKLFTDLRDSKWFKDFSLDRNYDALLDVLYLKPFWEDQRQLLFRGITQGFDVDWSRVRQRHRKEMGITRAFVENRTWIHNPYGRLDHQHLLIKIIDARLYCYIWVILYVYEKQSSLLDEPTLEEIKDLVHDVINETVDLSIKDEFLVVILSELRLAKTRDVDDIKDILARVTAKANELLDDLNGTKTTEIDWLSFDVDEVQLSTSRLIKIIIMDFHFYLNSLKSYCSPYEYKTLLHFVDVVKLSAARYL